MTTLGNEIVLETNGFFVSKHIAGDLSFTYEVRPLSAIFPDGFGGMGIATNSLPDAMRVIRLAKKKGYDKAYELWNGIAKKGKHIRFTAGLRGKEYDFGYLPEEEAVKYAPDAYGDYAKKIMKKYGLKVPKETHSAPDTIYSSRGVGQGISIRKPRVRL